MCVNLIKYNLVLILHCYYYYYATSNLNLQEADVNEKRNAEDDMEHKKFYSIMNKLMVSYQHLRLALLIMCLRAILNLSFVFSNYYLKLLCNPINFKALHIIENRLLYRHLAIVTFYT